MSKALVISTAICASLFTLNAHAQARKVQGTVVGTDQKGLVGVSVTVPGTRIVAVTDKSGKFSIEIAGNNQELQFTYVGFQTKKVTVLENQKTLNIVLEEQSNALEEVTVNIGYGTVKKKDLTGAVTSVGAETISKAPVSSALEAIAGRMAGIQISSTEGSPDAEMKVRVRGGGSVTGDNAPLYIVDGFPMSSISDIAPADIESIDVLKDASSAAIYGSRGANGVVIVTTKSAKSGKTSISYSAFGGIRNLAKKLDVLSPYDYVTWQYEQALLQNKLDTYVKYFGNFQDIDLYKDVPSNDWQELIFGRTGNTFNQNFNLSGGSDKTKYSISHSFVRDKAIMEMSGFRRQNVNFKLNHKPSKNTSIDLGARFSDVRISGGGMNEQNEASSSDSRLKFAMIYPPFPVGGLTNSDETDDEFNLYNPLESLVDNDQLQRRRTYNLNAAFSWDIVKNLRFRTEFGFDDYHNYNDRFYGPTTYYVRNIPAALDQNKPALISLNTSTQGIRSTNTLNYNFQDFLPKGHSLSVLVGQEYLFTQKTLNTNTTHGFPNSFKLDDTRKLTPQGASSTINNYMFADEKLLSFFGRVNYDFDSKYLFNATFRADGSSKFSADNYWGYFPSMAAAWRISSERFMDKTQSWLDDLKLRASLGTSGNNNIPLEQIYPIFSVKNTEWVNGYNNYWATSKTMSNPDLKWETTISKNIGLDFTLFKKKLSGTVDVYKNKTKDLLILFPIAGSGYDDQYRNLGETQNKGIELTLNWSAINKKNFDLNFSGNISFNETKVNSLGTLTSIPMASGWASTEIGTDYVVETGGRVGKMYGYVSDGRYEVSDFTGYDAASKKWILKDGVADASTVVGTIRPGTMKLKDLVGDDHKIDASDQTIIGDANPLHTGGFSINTRIYNFDITALFNWSYGNDIYNANKIEYTSTSKYNNRNMLTVMEEGQRWTNLLPDGTISNDPNQLADMNKNTSLWSPLTSKFVFSDWAVEDGSFLRLGTVTIGYTLPKAFTDRLKIRNFRVYISGYNLAVWTNYSGFDPEVSTRRKTNLTPGVDYSAYPKSRTFVAGLNLNF